MGSSRRSLALTLLLGVVAGRAMAQHESAMPAREVRGRVLNGSATTAAPLANAWVFLHRVGRERAGKVDSARTDARGGYRFLYRTGADTTALHFVSASRGGVTYINPPLTEARVVGADAELVVYDTTSRAFPLTIRGRHLIVEAVDSTGRRGVVEVYDISNDSAITRVSAGGTAAVFEIGLLDGARDARVEEGDFRGDAVRLDGTRASVLAPISPGVHQFAVRYTVPGDTAFSALLDRATDVLEVLIEDVNGRVQGAGLTAVAPVVLDGRSFTRALAQDVAAPAVLRLRAPTTGALVPASKLRWLAVLTVVGAALLVLLATNAMRGARRTT
ncbi:MAG: hypothetical protein K2X99_09640 [Gemmatimonadaceae bacterium]|nr:hypothetical protein [Gemmatimonadaceae bacterium]